MLFLFNVYRTKKSKKPFLSDISEGLNETEAMQKLINKTYYFDSEQKKVLGIGRKIKLIRIINQKTKL